MASAQWTWVWANSKEIVKDKEAWRADVDGVAKSQTWLNNNKKGRLTSQEDVTVKCALRLLLHWILCILPVHKVSLLIFSGIGQPCGPGNTCQVDQALSLGLSLNYKPHVSVLSKFVSWNPSSQWWCLEVGFWDMIRSRGGALKVITAFTRWGASGSLVIPNFLTIPPPHLSPQKS